LGLILAWRLALLVFTAQPVPSNDAFFFDGAVVNWLHHGGYFNPSLQMSSPISGREVFAAYPPGYQLALLPWMAVFGTSVISSMALHLVLVMAASVLVVGIITTVFPDAPRLGLAVLFLLGITFSDRPESLAHVAGLAALWLATGTAQSESGIPRVGVWTGVVFLLLVAVFTSPVGGAFYAAVLFVMTATRARFQGGRLLWWPFFAFALWTAGLILTIRQVQPLWWAGFLENARQSGVQASGLHLPGLHTILKLLRNAPVFGIFALMLPCLLSRAGSKPETAAPQALTVGVGVVGSGLLLASALLSSPNYYAYVLFSQGILAAGLLWWAAQPTNAWRRWLPPALACCLGLVSIRAVGMSTWGVACARDVSRSRANALVQAALQPAAARDEYAIVSSAFLYEAARLHLDHALHTDWTRGRGRQDTTTDAEAILRLRPTVIVLTQFDYYRAYRAPIEQVRQQTNAVELEIRDTAQLRPPDAHPSLQRIVQHISWAPIIIQLHWK